MICSSVNLFTKPLSILIITLAFGLSGCGGGGDSSPAPTITPPPPDETVETHSITGGGVKGPLANAVVTVYAFDAAQAGFKGAAVGIASTDASAAITGLALPFPLNPPYIMEFTSTPATTTDITTGMFPVITTMRTVITQASLDAGEQIYATPLTTMAVDIAVANAGTGATSAQFETALTAAAAQVVSTLGFGMDSSVNIFDTPPLINSTTVGTAEQVAVAAYRTAVEAVTAIAYQINQQSSGASTDAVLADLAASLADNGVIDDSAGTTLNTNTLQILEQDPGLLIIPNTAELVGNVQTILVTEKTITGSTTTTTELTDGTITTAPAPAETDPDTDNDGVLNVDDAFPENDAESVDTDGDGIGDVADLDDDNNGILDVDEGTTPAPTATDTDGDGVLDSSDNCSTTFATDQTNTDEFLPGGDLLGDVCDDDDDGDGVLDTADAFPLDENESLDTDSDGFGNAAADSDDDNDGVADGADTGTSPIDGTACSLLTDCDGDGVFDGADFDPIDAAVTINFAPVTTDGNVTTDEDVEVAVTLSVTDDGVAAGSLVYNISGPAHGVLSGTEPDLTYTPNAHFSGNDSFIYTVVDGAGKISNISGVDITVVAVNDAPIIAQPGPLSVVMDEDASPIAFVAPVINASDKEGDTLTWSLSSAATNGVATVSGTGAAPTVTYVPDADTNGPDSFDVTVSDGNGGSDVITIDVTVNAKNDAPVIAVTGPFSIAENAVDTTTVGSVVAADVDGPVTGYSIVSGDTGAAFAIDASGQITVADTVAIDYESATSFSLGITATDGAITSATQTVVVNVSDVNDTVPVVDAAGPFSIAEDIANTTAVGSVTATDVDTVGAVTAYNIISGDTSGAFVIDASGQITVADSGAIDYEIATSFNLTITATDSVNTSVGVVVVVNVSDVNDTAPVVGAAGPFSIAENVVNTTLVGSVSATDADTVGAVTNYNFSSGNIGGAFAISATGDITVANTALIDFEVATSFNIEVTATDGVNTSEGVVVVVNVSDANDIAPVVGAAGPFAIDENAANSTPVGTVVATDADTDTGVTSYSIASGNTGVAFAIDASGQITVADTAAIDHESAISFSLGITATDGTNTSVEQVVIININDVNDTAPVVGAAQSFNVLETAFVSTVVGTVSASDADTLGSITGFNITAGNTGTAFAIDAAGQVTVANTPLSGSYSLSVTATDSVNTSPAVTVLVTAVTNTPPVIAQGASVPVTMDEDGVPQPFVAPTITATDVEGDSLSWSTPGATNGVATVSGTGASPTITYVPNANSSAGDSFIVNVFDGISTVGITVNVTVDPVNDAPAGVDDNDSTDEDVVFTTINVLTNDTDIDVGDTLSVSTADISSLNGGVVVNHGNGTFDYTPALNFNGTDEFTYTVSDGFLTSVATVYIDVTPVNDAPDAVTDNETVTVDTVLITGDVLANDTDAENDTLTITASDTASVNGGTVSDNGNGIFTYTPATAYIGSDSFTYTVSDGPLSAVGTVNINVIPAGTPIDITELMGPSNGGITGLDNDGQYEYSYWTDNYDAGIFSGKDYSFNHASGAFEENSRNEQELILNAGSWTAVDNIAAVVDGSALTLALRDSSNTVLSTFKLTATYVDIGGAPIADYIDPVWQGAMFNADATFNAGAKLVTEYFQSLSVSYQLYTNDWCMDDGTDRYTVLNGDCNAIDSAATFTGYAELLGDATVASAWVDPDNHTTPPSAVHLAWEGSKTLMVQLVEDGSANYYVVDWNSADDASHVADVVAGANWVQNSDAGVEMIHFQIPESFVAQFPGDLVEGLNYFVTVQNDFVRRGQIYEALSTGYDEGAFNGLALTDILNNFSGDNYTTSNLAGKTIYDMYQDTDIDQYLIDVYTFDANGTFITYDHQTGLPSQETGTWDVNTSGKLHLTMTSGPDNGVQWWAKAKSMNPDNGSQRACYADNVAGPFKCRFLDVALGMTSRQFNDENTAVNKMNDRNSTDPQISQARTPNLKQFDGSRISISGLWIGEFDVASLTTGTHTLDFGEGPATLTFNIDGTGVMEFSPTEINAITSWSIDFNGVLRFTEQASDLSTADWTIGYFDAEVPGNVLVYFVGDDGSQFFVMGGFDQTLAAFDAAALAGTTQYNVFYCDDGDAGCTIGDWGIAAMAFDANGSDLVVTYGGFDYPGTYSVTSGVLVATFDGGTDYIRILSVDSATGANRTCWEDSLALTAECTGNGSEFFFDSLTAAQSFQSTVTFVDAGADAVTLLAGGGIYRFWDDEWDGSQEVPGYWNISLNGSTVVDAERIWSVAQNQYIPVSNSNDIVLASNGWYLRPDASDEITTSTNSVNLNTYDPVNTSTLLDQWNLSFEVMDIEGVEQALYAPVLGDQSAVFSTNAQLIRATFLHNNESIDLKHWTDCGEPSYTNWGSNCNIVWLYSIDGSLNVAGVGAATDIQTFVGDTTQTIELGWNNGNGNLLGVLNAGVITLYATNSDGSPATPVGTGAYTIRTNVNGVSGLDIIDYTLPAGFEFTYNLHYDEGNQGILSTYNGFWRHGEIEANGITGSFMMLNSVAANDVLNNRPVIPAIVGTWVENSWLGNPTFVQDVVSFFSDNNYLLSGSCDDVSLTNPLEALLNGETATGIELGPYFWNSTTEAFMPSASIDTNGFCPLMNTGSSPYNTLSVTGDSLTITDGATDVLGFTRLTPDPTNPIVGTWVTSTTVADAPTALIFHDNGIYRHSQSCEDHVSDVYGPQPIAAGIEYGTYSWDSTTGLLTGNVQVDTNGWCGLHSTNEAGTDIAPAGDALWIKVEGNIMQLQVESEGVYTLYRIEDNPTATGGALPEALPTQFSVDYLAGRTLYDVWYGIIDAGIGVGVSKVDFTETTMTWTGLVGEAGTITVPYTVDGNGLMTGGDAPEPGEGFEIVCGSTPQYIKSHHLNAGGVFDNTDLWFFNEADALAYAGTLIEAIAPCTSDLP